MNTYDEARTDTHVYLANTWDAYGTKTKRCFATTRAVLKEYKSDGLTVVDCMRARNGHMIVLHTDWVGQIPTVVELEFVEYNTLSTIEEE